MLNVFIVCAKIIPYTIPQIMTNEFQNKQNGVLLYPEEYTVNYFVFSEVLKVEKTSCTINLFKDIARPIYKEFCTSNMYLLF